MTRTTSTLTGERADLVESLDRHRFFLRFTVRDLTDEQAARRTTVSENCLSGLIKHVSGTEAGWVRFIEGGAEAMQSEWSPDAWTRQWHLQAGETLAGVLADYEAVARHTDELVATLPDLDAAHPLPQAPWFEPGATWSARRVLLHSIAETAQHAGHADIIREALDGQKTMG
ncbi:MAG: DinB family protein [Blastococcus sp.]